MQGRPAIERLSPFCQFGTKGGPHVTAVGSRSWAHAASHWAAEYAGHGMS